MHAFHYLNDECQFLELAGKVNRLGASPRDINLIFLTRGKPRRIKPL